MAWTSPRRNKNEMAKNAREAETPPSYSKLTTRSGTPPTRAKTSKVRGGGNRSDNDEDDKDEFRLHRGNKWRGKEDGKTTKRMKINAGTAAAYNQSDEDEESEDDDLDRIVAKNQDEEGEGKDKKKNEVRPLFTSGQGKKRSLGVSLWNRVRLEYYHTAEDNWREAGIQLQGDVLTAMQRVGMLGTEGKGIQQAGNQDVVEDGINE